MWGFPSSSRYPTIHMFAIYDPSPSPSVEITPLPVWASEKTTHNNDLGNGPRQLALVHLPKIDLQEVPAQLGHNASSRLRIITHWFTKAWLKEYWGQNASTKHCEAVVIYAWFVHYRLQSKVFGLVNFGRTQESHYEDSRLVLSTYRFRFSRRSRDGLRLVPWWKK